MDKKQIGNLAGIVWRTLSEKGKLSFEDLQRETMLDSESVSTAIGWLAREDKINFDEQNGITPDSVKTAVRALLEITDQTSEEITGGMEEEEKAEWIKQLEDQMLTAASALDFEKAAKLRDQLFAIRGDAPMDKHQPSRRRREKMRKTERG